MWRDGPSPLVDRDEPHGDQHETQPEEAHPYRQVLQLAMRVRVELLRVPEPSPFGVADHAIAVLLPRLFGRVEGA